MSIPELSVRRRISVFMIILIVTLFGAISYFNLGQDLIPDLEFPVLGVVTRYEGTSPTEVEKLITKPMEEVLATLKNVKRVSSVSQEGLCVVTVEFDWGTNIDAAAEDARSQLDLLKDFLPAEADSPVVLKFDPSNMPILAYAVTGMENGYQLRRYLNDVIAPKLEQITGVAMVMALGGEIREVQVNVDKEALDSFGLTLSQVIQALQTENIDRTGGTIDVGPSENILKVSGEFRTPEELEQVVVAWRGTRAVQVKDVAAIEPRAFREKRGRVRANRKPAVFMAVMKQSGANTTLTGRRVVERIEELKPDMPPDVEFGMMMDMGEVIGKITRRTAENALTGAFLAIFFVYLFLRNWRPTLAIFFAIPLALLTAFIGMYAMGYTFNLMTLGGLALGVGMLVDNAVVVVENTYRHLENGEPRIRSAIVGATEVDTAIVASTLTTVSVFIPMVLVGGVASRLARPLAFTICLALVSSLFVAITLVPAIAATLFRAKTQQELKKERSASRFTNKIIPFYKNTLHYLMNRGWIVLAVIGVLMAWLVFMFAGGYLGGEFLPQGDTPISYMQIELPVGSSLDDTDRIASVVEDYMLEHKDELGVVTVMANLGVFEDDPYAALQEGNPTDVNEGAIMARLLYREERDMTSIEIQDHLRGITPNLDPVQGAKVNFIDPFGSMMSTSTENAPVIVKIMGSDLEYLRTVAQRIMERVRAIDGIADVKMKLKEGKPEKHLRIERDRAAQFGLSTMLAAMEIRAALDGTVATRYREAGEEFDVLVRLEKQDRARIEQLLDLNIMTPGGKLIPLRQVATVEEEISPQKIYREGRRRKISILVTPGQLDLLGAVARIQQELAPFNQELIEHGSVVEYGGEYQDRQDTVYAMTWAGIAAVILVFMVMASQFESLYQPLVVMVTVPLGMVGVMLGLALTGKTVSLPSLLGTVILIGIVVNNAIVMIDYINLLRRRDGMPREQAIVEGAATRLRAILITSLTTILGMLPMALSRTNGSEMRSPMAIAVSSGLAFSMVLTLFVIPVGYNYFDKWAEGLKSVLARIMYGETERRHSDERSPAD